MEQIHEFANKNVDFAFETTLSGKSHAPFLRKLKNNGYIIHLFSLWIPNTDIALARIKERVIDGGHNVPVKDVKRHFSRGFYNFFKLYRPILDSWMLFNNSGATPTIIAEEKKGELTVIDKNLFKEILKKAGVKL